MSKEPGSDMDWQSNRLSVYRLARELRENDQTVYSAVKRLKQHGLIYRQQIAKLKRKNANRPYPTDQQLLKADLKKYPRYSRAVGRIAINPAVRELVEDSKVRKIGLQILADMVDLSTRYPSAGLPTTLSLSIVNHGVLTGEKIPLAEDKQTRAFLNQVAFAVKNWPTKPSL